MGYPIVLKHLGDHLRKRRLDLGLQVKEVAKQLGADDQSLSYWEQGRWEPGLRHLPAVIEFLGSDPRPWPKTLAERLVRHRTARGLSQEAMAKRLGIDPGTLWKWETGRREPAGAYLDRVEWVLKG